MAKIKATLIYIFITSVLILHCGPGTSTADNSRGSARLSEYLYSENNQDGFKEVIGVPDLNFPRDHGGHPEYRLEWWYLTGNLYTRNSEKPESDTGPDSEKRRHFGYQFTIFRNALHPPEKKAFNTSWQSDQMMMGHFALTDTVAEKFYAYEKMVRALDSLAFYELNPFRVYVENWAIESRQKETTFPLTVTGAAEGTEISLKLEPVKPVLLQGELGYSRKGPERHNASIYYSYTRLKTTGTVTVEGNSYEVKGLSWLDREISSSMLSADQKGWDWFALQLDDGSEMMFYRIRKKDGSPSPYTHMTLIAPDGSKQQLETDEYLLESTDRFTAESGIVYPSGWRLRIPALDTDLMITPRLKNQELNLSFIYWEGSVRVKGRYRNKKVKGDGYVELTGYDRSEITD